MIVNKQIWVTSILVAIIIFLISLFITFPSFVQLPTPTTLSVAEHTQKEISQVKPYNQLLNVVERKQETISEERLFFLTKEFMNKLVQKIDDDYRVINFNSKEELLDDFEDVMSRDIAKLYVDYYYEEVNNKLYIVPTETPPWFDEEKEYDMIQLNDNQIKVVQENSSVFYDHFIIEIELTLTDKWKITDVVIK